MKSIIFCTLLLAINIPAANAETLTFGVVPQQSASKLARLWTPILEQVSREVGVRIEFRTAKDIPTFEQRLASGEYDFAYMNPYHFTVFNVTCGTSVFFYHIYR